MLASWRDPTLPTADRGVPIDWPGLRRVLVVRPDSLGEVVLLTPALRALRKALPAARLELLACPTGAVACELVAELDGLVVVRPSWRAADSVQPTGRLRVWREQAMIGVIAGRGYDAMLVFTSAGQSPWPAAHAGLLAGIPLRAVHSAENGGAVATHWVIPPPPQTHQVDRSLHLLSTLGVALAGTRLGLKLPAKAPRLADSALRTAGRSAAQPFALLAPGASCPVRRYPPERFAAVAALLADVGLRVVVTGAPRETDLIDSVVAAAGHPGVCALGQVTVSTLAAVVSMANVLVANNSDCVQLAEAMGTPVAMVCGESEQVRPVQPRTVPCALLRRGATCPPTELASAAVRLVRTAAVTRVPAPRRDAGIAVDH